MGLSLRLTGLFGSLPLPCAYTRTVAMFYAADNGRRISARERKRLRFREKRAKANLWVLARRLCAIVLYFEVAILCDTAHCPSDSHRGRFRFSALEYRGNCTGEWTFGARNSAQCMCSFNLS